MPDGTPMDASDIAEMLNSYKEPPKLPIKTEVNPMLNKVGYFNYPIVRKMPRVGLYNGQDFHHTGIEDLHIPQYSNDFVDIINEIAVQNMCEGITISEIVVGYDIYYNLDFQLKNRKSYQYISQTIGDDCIVINVSSGSVVIRCTINAGEITPIYKNHYDALRMIK